MRPYLYSLRFIHCMVSRDTFTKYCRYSIECCAVRAMKEHSDTYSVWHSVICVSVTYTLNTQCRFRKIRLQPHNRIYYNFSFALLPFTTQYRREQFKINITIFIISSSSSYVSVFSLYQSFTRFRCVCSCFHFVCRQRRQTPLSKIGKKKTKVKCVIVIEFVRFIVKIFW